MATTVDPHTLAREGLAFLEPDGPLARWVERAHRVELELEADLHRVDELAYDVAAVESGLTTLQAVHDLLEDLVDGGRHLSTAGRAELELLVEVMVR